MNKTESLHKALRAAVVALNDWTHSFAPDLCGEEHVKETQLRLNENGTLFYIATIVKQCTDALKENEMSDLHVSNLVRFEKTGDDRLDGKTAIVTGFYGLDGIIVEPTSPTAGYNPSLVVSRYCLTKA